jgi:hypothetical protein
LLFEQARLLPSALLNLLQRHKFDERREADFLIK